MRAVVQRENDPTDPVNPQSNTIRIDYNPISGVTFKENRTSDVQVVGRGYNDEALQNDGKGGNGVGANKTKRRQQRGKDVYCYVLWCFWLSW